MGDIRKPGQTKPSISGGRKFNKPTAPENIKAGKTMRQKHDKKGVHKPVSKKQPEGTRTISRGVSERH